MIFHGFGVLIEYTVCRAHAPQGLCFPVPVPGLPDQFQRPVPVIDGFLREERDIIIGEFDEEVDLFIPCFSSASPVDSPVKSTATAESRTINKNVLGFISSPFI